MKEEIKQLVEEVKKHDLLYEQGTPIITDSEYDILYNRLLTLEKKYPEYALEDSPTKKIYTVLVNELDKVEHEVPLLSLEKETTEDGLRKFLGRFSDNDYITVGHKEDGLSVKLEYRDGVLYKASTRGDGYVGEDITHSIRLLDTVPNYIDFKERLELRGEAIITFEDFERVNVDGEYRSPRNLVSGSVRTLDASVAKERGVKVLIFDIINWENLGFRDWEESYKMLKVLGFSLTQFKTFKNDEEGKEELIKYCIGFEDNYRKELRHMVDGLVLKVNSYEERKKRGTTSKYPKWAVAFKFSSMDATTKLMGVEWSVGKTGQITPNAILKPVEIDGVLISRASLANYANIKARDIRMGDTVIVARANDVIPQVVSAVNELRTGEEKLVELIEHCPSCESKLEKEYGKDRHGNEAVTLYCRNVQCEAQELRVLENFVSRGSMDIDGLGEGTLEILYKEGIIKDIPSLYDIKNKKEQITSLEGFGEKKFNRMVEGIEKSKEQPLERVIKGLGIRNIGSNVSGILTDKYMTWEELKTASENGDLEEYLSSTKGIGDVLKKSVLTAFKDINTLKILDKLKEYGCKLEQPQKVKVEKKLDKTFVLTGKMFKSRNEIKKDIESLGGKVVGSVSNNTDYLVLGGYDDDTGEFEGSKSSKHKKAEELGVKIISDKKLLEDFLNRM